jgi:RNA polymerase sigma-70 factor (family 1)
MADDEKKWVKALQSGKKEALAWAFQKYHHALYYHALDFLKSPAMAEDAVQEVFVKVWENRKQIKPDLSFKAYLFCITKNHILNQLKRISREIKAREEISRQALTSHNAVEEQVVYAEYEAFARKALDELPPKRKKVFMLHRLEGKKYGEIAVLMNISKNTVRDHVVKADKSIKEYFADQANIVISLLLALIIALI